MKRRIAIILVLLAGGAIVNVAVAWVFTSWVSMTVNYTDGSLDPSDRAWVVSNGGTNIYAADVPTLAGLSETRNAGLSLTLVIIPAGGTGYDPAAQVTRAGWPLKTFLGGRVFPTGLNTAGEPDLLIDALDVSEPGAPQLWRKQMPLRPIWPGFILNTLFYALLLWLLFFAPFAARRMLRRRRGQCEKCAYPIGVSPVCTECGAAVSRKIEA